MSLYYLHLKQICYIEGNLRPVLLECQGLTILQYN